MQNAKKAKTGSAPDRRLIDLITVLLVLVSAISLILLPSLKPRTSEKPVNCEGPTTKSEIFHCNITDLEYVVEPAQRTLGLSGRDGLSDAQGMVFVFNQSSRQCMWMKEMKFNLDIVWLDENKKIIKILENVSPDTYPTSYCADDTSYVLEVNAGSISRLGLGVGDSVQL